MKTAELLNFINELKQHSNKEWMHEHKKEYQAAQQCFYDLLRDLLQGLDEGELSFMDPKELTYRMVRDTRFSKDKSLYNPNFRAHLSTGGKLPIPVGYYISLTSQNQSFIGGGLFADVFNDATTMIRSHIQQNPDAFLAIINDSEFRKYFKVGGTKLKKLPKGYEEDAKVGEYLRYKSWYLEAFIEDELIAERERFIAETIKLCRLMKPFNDFLNAALIDFVFPERH